jgi:hypothetical protein
MRAREVSEEKKRKMTMLGSTGGSSSGAPPKYHMVYMPPVGQPCRPLLFWGNCPQFQPQQQFTRIPSTPQKHVAAKPPQHFTPIGYPRTNCGKVGHFAKNCY